VRDSAAPPSEEARVSEGRATAGHRAERRSVVVVGTQARASADFRLDDLASSSGRLDALLRCVRAGLMVSHGLRADVDVYLVLLGGPRAPRTLRFRGDAARFLRPDERSLALTAQKRLAEADAAPRPAFVALKPGIDVVDRGVDAALEALVGADHVLLDRDAPPLEAEARATHVALWLGDHRGLPPEVLTLLDAEGARRRSVSPRELHAEDAITLAHGVFDRG
jgi:tRNA (pseudouridine54-N1)-methyltransferase